MNGHHPFRTSWTGFYEDARTENKDEMEFKSLVINNGSVNGGGEDSVGKFELLGTKVGDDISFVKAYPTHKVVYQGRIRDLEDGQTIEGRWHLESAAHVSGPFELTRSLELERKREAAFRMVVSRMKMFVGLIRFFFEDVGFTAIQAAYLASPEGQEGLHPNTRHFTLLSMVAGLLVSILGPIMECYAARRHRREGMELADPGPPPSVDGGRAHGGSRAGEGPGGDYSKLAETEAGETTSKPSEAYIQRRDQAKELTKHEFLSGNLDYVSVLMERPDVPAEVPDIAITDIIATSRGVHGVLLSGVLLFWTFVLSVPFVFHIDCTRGIPAKAHLCFCTISFLNCFLQIWCAAFTKYGYLMLVHAPQQFAFGLILSFFGGFDSYSDIAFIEIARSCGSWLWKPAASVYIVGVLLAQALPGILLLACKTHIPAALKLTEMNVLLLLLKPSVV
uniref:Uncharacterized protein n=1 Tax=Noctiluca scintillans TaxID=2966 RepID=A0A7S1B0X2_NOCSC